jgi:hypothetical protein
VQQEAWPFTADELHAAQHDTAVVVTLQPVEGLPVGSSLLWSVAVQPKTQHIIVLP